MTAVNKSYSQYGKVLFNYIHFIPDQPSDKLFLFWPGSGEGGSIDGSEIGKAMRHAYPKFANQGFPFPFHVIALQGVPNPNSTPVTQDFRQVEAGLFRMMDELGFKEAVMGGLSQGGQQALKYLWKHMDTENRIKAIISAGANAPSGSKFPKVAGALKDIPVIDIHGDNDKSGNSMYSLRNFLNEIKKLIATPPILYIIPGGDHDDSWNHGFDPRHPLGSKVYESVLQFMTTEEPVPVPVEIAVIKTTYNSTSGKIIYELENGEKIER